MAKDSGATGIDVDDFMRQLTEKAAPKAAKAALRDLAVQQRKLINAEKKPDGSAQKANAKSTARRKGGRKPLWDKGILRDSSQWIVRKRGDEMVLRPPPARRASIYINQARGYHTVFYELPPDFEDKTLQGRLDEEMAKVKAKAKRRQGKG